MYFKVVTMKIKFLHKITWLKGSLLAVIRVIYFTILGILTNINADIHINFNLDILIDTIV